VILSRYLCELIAGLVKSEQRPFLYSTKISKLHSFSTGTSNAAITASYVVLDGGFLNLHHKFV
jgi:hypothetical protein